MNIDINYLALFIAVIASMVVGFAWYSPLVFGKPWMKLMGHTPESIKKAQSEMGKWYLLSAAAVLVTAFVLSQVLSFSQNFYGNSSVMTAVTSAFWMWLGFVMPVQLTDAIFGKRNWALFTINTGYQLVSLLVMGVILGLIR